MKGILTPFVSKTRLLALFFISICIGLLLYRYPFNDIALKSPLPSDFLVYLRAWTRVSTGETPYVLGEVSPYKYSPGVLALIGLLPLNKVQAWVNYSTFCLLFLGVALYLGSRYQSYKSVLLLVVGLTLSWKGILETLDYGQVEILLFSIVILACTARMRQPFMSGFLAGTLPWFKPPWMVFLLPLILSHEDTFQGPGKKKRRIRILISGFLFSGFFWAVALPTLTFGGDRTRWLMREWFKLLQDQPQSLFLSDVNQSFWVTALRWAEGNLFLAFGIVAIWTGYILGCIASRTIKITLNREIFVWASPWLVLIQLLNPLSWRWGSVFLIGMPFAIAGATGKTPKWILRFFLMSAVAVLWLLQLNPVVKAMGYHHWSDIHGYGIVTLYWLGLLLLALHPVELGESDNPSN